MIKLGNNDITLKVGSADVSAAYLGSVLVYSGGTPPTPSFDGKWLATYTGGTTSSAQCDSSSAITSGEITLIDLVSVEIGQCVTTISGDTFRNCTSLTSATIPNSVTSIGSRAFHHCSGLTSITIPSGVTSIGATAFANCSGLSSITIPSGVTSILSSTFASCTSLTSVTIPDSVTSIGSSAFQDCNSLTSVTVEATTPPTLGRRTFDGTNNCPIYVPAASISAYQTASRWSDYADRIQAIPTPSPQWVTFNSGDDISGLNVYGVKGVASNLAAGTFSSTWENIHFELSRNIVNAVIGDYSHPCYNDTYGINDNVELIFGNIGCSDYYTLPASKTALSTIQLYIYQ